MSGGGLVKISTRRIELDADYCAQRIDVSPGSYVEIVTTDHGRGMDAATRARIFEPFFTTKEFGKGTGLGLSIVYGIVKQSGGHIEVESEIGRGASFSVFLPRVDMPAQVATPGRARPPSRGDRVAKVLLVEDDDEVRHLLQHYLRSDGYEVMSAADALQALDLMQQKAIDLLVTDIILPGMRGDLLAKHFCQQHPNGRVLFISGYAAGFGDGPLNAPRARHRILNKPFNRDALLAETEALLEPRRRTTSRGRTRRSRHRLDR
jgi:CheY-like chemotaxis protein